MKTALNIILVALCVTFFSCQKDDLSTGSSSITSNGILSGKIVNYVPNSIDSLKAMSYDFVGLGKVSTTGDFYIRLTIPRLSKVGKMSGITVSDTTAMIGIVDIESYLNSNYIGVLFKCNYSSDSINNNMTKSSIFTYSDKEFTEKGTHVDSGAQYNITYIYNLTFKKGWNEVVYKYSYSTAWNSVTMNKSWTNNITSDIQWHFFKSVN